MVYLDFIGCAPTNRVNIRPSRYFFHVVSGVVRGTPALVTPNTRAAGVAGSGRILHLGRSTLCYTGFMRQAEERCRLLICLLYVCADFASSAPLGSQPDDSLLRRSLSSPYSDYNMRENKVKMCSRMTGCFARVGLFWKFVCDTLDK